MDIRTNAIIKIDLGYFKKVQDDDILLDEGASQELEKIYYLLYSSAWNQKYIVDLINGNFVNILIKIFDLGYKFLKNAYQNLPNEQPKSDIFKPNKQLSVMDNVTSMIRNLSFYSVESNQELQKQDGIRVLLNLLGDEELMNAYLTIFNEEMLKNDEFAHILSNTIGGLENLAMNSTSFLTKWNESNSVQILLNFSEKYKQINDWKLNAYMTLANIASDEEIDKLPSLHNVIEEIIHVISLGAKGIKSGLTRATQIDREAVVKRGKIPIKDYTEPKEVCMIYLNNGPTGWSLSELFEGLYHMAINDSVKNDIYTKYAMSEHLRDIIYKGNQTEIAYAIKLLWQLCFDQRVLKLVGEDTKLIEFIKDLIKRNTDKAVTESSKGILFRLDSSKSKEMDEKPNDEIPSEKHIMISYNKESRDMCLKIKEQLEKINFKVWIDISSIHGSSLDSMAKAIENSFCVLICMTEKYKMSNYCRAEAEYTFQLNKPFIPIKMQKDYNPDGWLGIMIGSKIFIDFIKYSFDVSMKRLKTEISQYSPKSMSKPEKTAQNVNGTNSIPSSSYNNSNEDNNHSKTHFDEIVKWNENEVEKWINEKKFNSDIVDSIFPCNGAVLYQYFLIQKETPEFFYQSLAGSKHTSLKYIAAFQVELKKLFNDF